MLKSLSTYPSFSCSYALVPVEKRDVLGCQSARGTAIVSPILG